MKETYSLLEAIRPKISDRAYRGLLREIEYREMKKQLERERKNGIILEEA